MRRVLLMDDRYTWLGLKTPEGFKQTPFRVMDQEAIKRLIIDNYGKDTYITPNEFKTPESRTKDNVALVKEIFIDFDYHLAGGFTLSEAAALVELMKPQFNRAIPTPSKIIHSGRGIHYYIAIEPERDIAKYELVAKGIAQAVDKVVNDCNPLINTRLELDKRIGSERFIRVEGSYNTAAKITVSAIYKSESLYDLDVLISDFIPELTEIKKNGTKQAREVLNYGYNRRYKGYSIEYNALSWLYAAMDDLKSLQRARNDDVRISGGRYYFGNDGLRNVMLFNFGLLCKHAFNDTQTIYESMEAFNRNYTRLLDSAELQSTYKSVITNAYKPPKNKKLIHELNITPQEQMSLKTLISKCEVTRRAGQRVKRNRAKQSIKKQLEKHNLKTQAIQLHNSGVSYREIAKQLNISIGTVHNYLK